MLKVAQEGQQRQVDAVLARLEIQDRVGAAILGQDKDVGPGTAAQRIVARPVPQNIRPAAAREQAIPAGQGQQIVTGPAGQDRVGLGKGLAQPAMSIR